jgi:hypothetical protein
MNVSDLVTRIQHAQSLAADLASLAREDSNLFVPEDILNIATQLSNRISAMLEERRQKSAQVPKDAVITHLLTTNAGEFTIIGIKYRPCIVFSGTCCGHYVYVPAKSDAQQLLGK